MKNRIKTLLFISLAMFLLQDCKKEDTIVKEAEQETSIYYFRAQIDNIESEAETMGMTSLSPEIRWITAENGTGGFSRNRGAIGIKIHKDYLKVGSYTLNSSTKDKYSGEFLTATYGEVDSIYSTVNTVTEGVLKIDKIAASETTNIMNEISGRFAFYAVEKDSGNGVVITYGEFKILAHSALFN